MPFASVRELRIAGEIAQAFLTARRPIEVYRMALERVAPLVGAAFACVFLRDDDPELLRVVTAYNWPQRYANYLGSMRVRVGNGPTGRAVFENRLIDVEDVFADPELSDWWDSAKELRFKSAIALPLIVGEAPLGSLTFYYRDHDAFRETDRGLLKLVADQLAATADKARLIEHLEQMNAELAERNSELEARQREAENAMRIRTEFLVNVSHELRTPLTAMLGYAFMLKEGLTGRLSDAQAGTVAKLEVAGRELVSLINGLMDLTSLKLGHMHAKRTLCDAIAMTRAAFGDMPSPTDGVELKLQIPDGSIPIHTDPALVHRVLQNLLDNAVKFTSEGSITVRLRIDPEKEVEGRRSRGGEVVWEVADTGIGVDPKNHELIFEEFRQADGSATRSYVGAGLGLAVARGLAGRLGGEIGVESEPGKGSVFSLRLPSSVIRLGAR
ncbi:MAG: GAF domain-containing protein [Gemmatimonas sp.]|nr:GAF domain-containing protein [Gemmatimonas sp.]